MNIYIVCVCMCVCDFIWNCWDVDFMIETHICLSVYVILYGKWKNYISLTKKKNFIFFTFYCQQ